MAREKRKGFFDFLGFGSSDEYEDDEEYFDDEEEEEAAPRSRRRRDDDDDDEDRQTRSFRKPKVVPMQENGKGRSSVVIHSPKNYNDAQPLVRHMIQNKYVIVKLDKVDKRDAQRILDFMSGATYACGAQISEVSKGSIYLFTSGRTSIEQQDDFTSKKAEDGYQVDVEEF